MGLPFSLRQAGFLVVAQLGHKISTVDADRPRIGWLLASFSAVIRSMMSGVPECRQDAHATLSSCVILTQIHLAHKLP